LGLALVGCASTPSSTTPDKAGLEAPKPTYTEKSSAVLAQALHAVATCPHDMNYEKEDWHKMVAYANACVKTKDWARTERVGNSLAKLATTTPWGPYYMALAATQRKDYPRAQWMLELALKKAPNEGILHYELGRLYWDMSNDALAMKELKQASELNPALGEAHLVMGQMALQRGDYSEARGLLRKALNTDGKMWTALMASAEVERRSNDFVKAEDFLNQAIAVNPRSSRARMALAEMQEMHMRKISEALAGYKTLRQMNASHQLDEGLKINLDEKIQSLEKSLPQIGKNQVTDRSPSAERKVKK
jgi:tetratricopeptide (TPR) repeat protein